MHFLTPVLFLLANVARAVIADLSITEGSCCTIVQQALSSRTFFPQNSEYNKSANAYWSAQETHLQPSCYVVPQSSDEVSIVVRSLVQYPSCQFAIKSGGHMAQAGAANIQDGITIDLSALTQLNLTANNTLAQLGPGLRWGQVYQALEEYGLAVLGGRSADVGVGGFLLGGGLGYFPGRGFGCDNVVAYEIVLADGNIATVTNETMPDLFRALKGGSSNFGIVTSYTVQTFLLGEIWGGDITSLAADTIDQQLSAFYDFVKSDESTSAVQMSICYDAAYATYGNLIVNQPFSMSPVADPFSLEAFTTMPQILNATTTTNLSTFAIKDASTSPHGNWQMTFAMSIKNDLETLHDVYSAFNASVAFVASVANLSWCITLEPIPDSLLAESAKLGPNMLGLPASTDGDGLILIDSSFTWVNAEDSELVTSNGRLLLNALNEKSQQRGTFMSWIDVNHADSSQNPMASFNATNLEFLRGVGEKYDPTGVFQQQVPGGFKLY